MPGRTNRRTVLTALVGASAPALAGCPSRTSTDETPTDEAAGTETSRDTTTQQPTAACPEPETPTRSDSDGRFSVRGAVEPTGHGIEVRSGIAAGATTESPGVVALTLTNTTDQRATLQTGAIPPLGGLTLTHEHRDAALVVLPQPRPDDFSVVDANDDGEFTVVPDQSRNGCWAAIDRPVAPDTFETIDLPACGSFDARFQLLAAPDSPACVPPGQYTRSDELTRQGDGASFQHLLTVTVSETD